MKHTSQAARVLAYMASHGSITVIEAERYLNCHRLAARISDLKAQGVAIDTTIVHRDGTRWASYRLTPAPEQVTAFS